MIQRNDYKVEHWLPTWILEWGMESDGKCQLLVFPLCPWPVAPFDLSSRASHCSGTSIPNLFKAKPGTPFNMVHTNSWLTLYNLWRQLEVIEYQAVSTHSTE